MKLSPSGPYTNQHHHAESLLSLCAMGCAFFLSACGSEAVGANTPSSDGNQQEVAAAEPGNGIGVAGDASDPGAYIFIGNFAGEPPPHDLFSEPGHAFIHGFVPDGDYVYQVTDTKCSELLAGPGAPGEIPSTEARVISVAEGRFEAHPAAPFLPAQKDTSGEYVVHVTPIGELGAPSEGCYGFQPETTYTAKFAVVPGPMTDPGYCVSGGVFEAGKGMEGIEVVVFRSTQAEPVVQTFTMGNGMYEICGLKPGEEYQVRQLLPDGYAAVTPANSTVTVANITREDLVVQPFENEAR